MANLFNRLSDWYRELPVAGKILYPLGAVVVLGGIVTGALLLFGGPGEGGTLIPEDVEVLEVELPPVRQLTDGQGNDFTPAPSPDGSRIAFCSDRAGNRDLYSVDTTGGDLVQLTHDTAEECDPHYSPDGSLLAYASDQAGKGFDIWVAEATGADAKRLTVDVGDEFEPRWSPLPFRTDQAYHRLLYTADKGAFTIRDNGTDRRPVDFAGDGGRVEHTRWSPHGLGFIAQRETDDGPQIVGSGLEEVVALEGLYGRRPVLAPNMTGILFIGTVGGRHRVYYYEPARNRLLKLNELTEPGSLAWAPDGAGFYFTDAVDGYSKLFYQELPLPLADVVNLWQYPELTPAALEALERGGVVHPGRRWELFSDLYLAQDPGEVLYPADYHRPSYITADVVLELTDYYFDFLLQSCEEETVRPALDSFFFTLGERVAQERHRLQEAREYALGSPGSQLVEALGDDEAYVRVTAALDYLGDYFAVGGELLVPAAQIRPEIPNPDAHAAANAVRRGTGPAPVVSREGTTYPAELFSPPAAYQRNSAAADYYRAHAWASLVKFDLTDPERALEAAVATHLLATGETRQAWERLDGFFAEHYGDPDDFDIDTLDDLLRRSYGADVALAELTDPEGLERFMAACGELQEQIGGVDPAEADEPPTFALFAERSWPLEDYLTGLSGFSGGADDFGRTAKLLDIAAANGSVAAWRQLVEVQGEDGYPGYVGALEAVQLELRRNTGGLFYELLYCLRPYLDDPPTPVEDGLDETVQRALGLRGAYCCCGFLTARSAEPGGVEGQLTPQPPAPAQGEIVDVGLPHVFLEPSPKLFERLAELVKNHHDTLRENELFPEFAAGAGGLPSTYVGQEGSVEELMAQPSVSAQPVGIRVEDTYLAFYELLGRLGALARQQSSGVELTEEDRRFLLGFGRRLAALTEDCFRGGVPGAGGRSTSARSAAYNLGANAQGTMYLNAGVAGAEEVLRLVDRPAGGRLLVCGAAYAYYERTGYTPLERTAWLSELETAVPPRPGWTASFIPAAEATP